MFKILQARLQQYVNHELLDIQGDFRKGRGTKHQISNMHWLIEEEKNSRKKKKSTLALLTMPLSLTVWITTNAEKSSRDGNT